VRISWLKETLGTKEEKRARVLAKPVMMKFDRILAQARLCLPSTPCQSALDWDPRSASTCGNTLKIPKGAEAIFLFDFEIERSPQFGRFRYLSAR
jgi:hypothetical protein